MSGQELMALTKDIDFGVKPSWPLSGRFFFMTLNIQKNILLASYTTFKIGGPAKYFSEAKSVDELRELCKWAKEEGVPIFVLGGGSNVLISDKGFDGLVIKIKFADWRIEDAEIFSETGLPLAKLVLESAKKELTGLEWAMGIPGTVGGAINGNAGAFGKSMSETVERVNVFDISKFESRMFNKEECGFGYRNSIFKGNNNFVILSVVLLLNKGNREEIRTAIKDFTIQRVASNPSGFSAGCFFRNPGWEEVGNKNEIIAKFPELEQFSEKPKISAGFLIENVGMKGKKIGGAMVSEKHANFIINDGGKASAEEIVSLTNLIKEKIRERYGFDLEDEVVII